MANIIGLQQQQEALKEIQAIIKDLTITNNFLSAQNPSGVYTIIFKDGDGKKHSTELSGSKEEINELVNRYKKEKREYVQALAQEYRIALDLEDNVILGVV